MTEYSGRDKHEFSWAAQALDDRCEDILEDYQQALEAMESFLLAPADHGWRPLERRARGLLDHAAGMLRSDGRSAAGIEKELLRTIKGDPDVPVDAHPDEAVGAAMALCRAAAAAVKDAPAGTPPGDALEVGLRIQESIVGPMGRVATVAYSNYLMYKIHETQVVERRRFSRELHDRVAHSVAVVGQNLELYRALRDRAPEEAERKLERAGELTREAMTLARNISAEMRGTSADEGMEVALENLLKFTVGNGIEYEVTRDGDDKELPEHVRDQLYLIMREGVRNAVSHSGGQRIEVRLGFADGAAVGVISDYGRGFDPDVAHNGDGVGLKSMRERAELLGGRLEIFSTPESGGTRVEVTIPLRQGP